MPAPPAGLLEIGRIARAHGIDGELYVELLTDRTDRLDVGAQLWARDRWLTVARSRPQAQPQRWLVRFAGVDDRSTAERLTGAALLAEPVDDPDAMWVHDLVGASVRELDGTDRGRCVAVVANPAADLLELDSGALVPVTFVTGVEAGVISIDPPEGLFDI